MGYGMNVRDRSFRIEAIDKKKALAAIKKLAGKETIHDDSGSPHYSWVDTKLFLAAKTLEQAMYQWRWDIEENDRTGAVTDIWFAGEKLGDDETLFQAIAPWVKDGSFIEMMGEDGAFWKWVFQDGEVTTQYGTVVYE